MAERLPTDGVIALRAWSEADADELVTCLDGDEEITRWLDRIPQPYTREDARAYIGGSGEDAYAVIEAAGPGDVLGAARRRLRSATNPPVLRHHRPLPPG